VPGAEIELTLAAFEMVIDGLAVTETEAGALAELPLALSMCVYSHLFAGDLTAAAFLLEELRAATDATGTTLAPYGAVGLAAMRGREGDCIALITGSRDDVTQRGEGIGVLILDWAEAVLYNGLGRYEDAAKTLEAAVLLVPGDPTINDHLGDALWRAGHHIDARFQWNHALTFADDDTDKAAIERKLKTGLSEKPA